MRGCPALMWKASPSALTANFLEAREEPFELEQERKLGDSCECVCWFPAAPGANSPDQVGEGRRGQRWLLLSQGRSCSSESELLRREPGLCHHPHPRCRARMLDQLCSPVRGGGGETSVKTTLQLCQHTAPTLQMLQCYFIQVSLWLPV